MPSQKKLTFFKDTWALVTPYWKSPEKRTAWLLLGTITTLDLGQVYMNVLFNQWQNSFYNALQELNQAAFFKSILWFSFLAVIFIIMGVYNLYLNQMLLLRWRRWLTHTYLERWLYQKNYYRMQLSEQATDNPDQRISEDITQFTSLTLSLTLGLLSAIVTLFSFIAILWTLSGPLNFKIGNTAIHIPGYMVWAAIGYAVIGTWLTNRIGYPLIHLNFKQQRFEADFRFSMARLRENSESVAFYHGELQEYQGFKTHFSHVFHNFWQIMKRQKRLTWFTSFYKQTAIIFPFLVSCPRLFSKEILLGGVMQIVNAFALVQEALSYIINSYAGIATWKATSDRLITFNQHMEESTKNRSFVPTITPIPQIQAQDLTIKLPNGDILLDKLNLSLNPGDSVLITGPSGCGKTTLLRTLAGIWPFAAGQLALPEQASMLFLPQKPYLPLGNLRSILGYPNMNGLSDQQAKELLQFCQLEHLYARLDQHCDWSRMLSIGEQQRIAIARAIWTKADFIFLDEATSGLDEAAQNYLYQLLRSQCPNTCIVSVGHRSSLKAWHGKELAMNKLLTHKAQ